MKKYLRRNGDVFVKAHGPTVLDDWQQVTALAELTAGIPGLRTAVPRRLDAPQQRIEYEWLGDLPRMITLPPDRLMRAVTVMGSGLAEIQAQGTNCPALSDTGNPSVFPLDRFGMDRRTSAAIDAQLPIGFFHGDCWHGNILIDEAGDCVLLDPIQSPWLFGPTRWGLASGIVDLATLHMSLFVSFRILPLMRLDLDAQIALGDALLHSYLEHFDAQKLRPRVLQLSRAIAQKYVSSYPTRINIAVGWVKLLLSKRLIRNVDAKLAW